MHGDAEAQSLLPRRGSPRAHHIAMRPKIRGVPRLMLRVPRVEAVMMIGERDEDSRARLLVARDQLVGVPVQQRPLRAKILVSKPRGMARNAPADICTAADPSMYMLRAYQSPASGTHCGLQCAQMPNLASRYHSGASYCSRESQVGL